MLYTTHHLRLDDIPEDAIKLIIMRFPPKEVNMLKYDKIHVVAGLSPSNELINWYNTTYKTYDDWREYEKKFAIEIQNREDMNRDIEKVAKLVERGNDVFLICCEKNYNKCHRMLLGNEIKKRYGIEWQEYK